MRTTDRPPKAIPTRRSSTSAPRELPPAASPTAAQPAVNSNANGNADAVTENGKAIVEEASPVHIPRPLLGRRPSNEKTGPNGTPPSRRNSWFTNISSKFSSSPNNGNNNNNNNNNTNNAQAIQQPQGTPPKDLDPVPPKVTPAKNAVLPHAVKNDGDQPYIPAPPGRGQAGFLGVFRRLSSSGGVLGQGTRGTHGLVERKVLNVDRNRERCPITELHHAKLRRVAFSVDVEIAPMPKYVDSDALTKKPLDKPKTKKMTEKGEGEALKNPKCLEEQKERDGVIHATGESVPKEPETEGMGPDNAKKEGGAKDASVSVDKDKDSKKKEKKKKSEEERKARKEKKRKQAEANGTIPMEIHVDDSDSSSEGIPAAAPKTTASPTTNPVRIYRRCCQLRETPILKKITEQLSSTSNCSSDIGMVQKLDLTGYWMQLPDLVTLGDYLAVVPVKEVILENCGLTDEGLRVILAGLLATKRPESRRRKHMQPDGLATQGGFVERLVLKNNKIGPEGWRHICLFIYLCRTLKFLDLSTVSFPRPSQPAQNGHGHGLLRHSSNEAHPQNANAVLFSKAIGERLGGSTLELLNLGETNLSSDDLGVIIDGIIQCGVKRLGLAHNNIDEKGLHHVARYLSQSGCEGLDLGGNDIRDHMDIIASAISAKDSLWALSLAECNLKPGSLCKILPALAQLEDFRFVDLSHNRDLCKSEPSAIGLLRKYLPKMEGLRRVHLADVAMTSEQAIALAEILPEAKMLAHISFLENPELVKLADAKTEEAQEEACALYASFLAATRVSKTIVCVDIDVPSDNSGEVVKALAKQVVAYCLRNMERFPIGDMSSVISTVLAESQDSLPGGPIPPYPDVLAHLVGHDVLRDDSDNESAPDDDYVIGGTGVVKALTCCLKNRGDESRRQSGEFIRDFEDGVSVPIGPRPKLPPGKAKDMSKHLLASARKIRLRLQPALSKARVNPDEDEQNLRKLMFLDATLANIIKRFEDEFPDTRVSTDEASETTLPSQSDQLGTSLSSTEDPDQQSIPSDAEDETGISVRPGLQRTNSVLSNTSKALAEEEGRIHRAGHKIRSGIIKPEYYGLLSGVLEVGLDPKHMAMLHQMIEEVDDPELTRKVEEKGIMRVFNEDRDQVREGLRALDPSHWDRFVESQEKARGNVKAAKPADENAIDD
ncbi:cell wall biogenesis protein Mhp1 [Colletotrichum graminicola M1.001]|uniref:Cell wall biogenesis protein Mhp1 n=1 Tax=Colletotrichum graminicola (strain M1.001 / M2 / FGSC 10212) TaxID=645133 RepID=E3QBL3_COLGM|nr:cell wall biogenesis protein Mhp1 [Colletotrichum graminicola M1.001]EFQ28352.1 cell wall biogenesis protein Mhp1 [Colletotrichum graminicola M1.001]